MYYMSQNTFDEKLFLVEFEGGAGLQLCESFLLFFFLQKNKNLTRKRGAFFNMNVLAIPRPAASRTTRYYIQGLFKHDMYGIYFVT